MLSSADEDSPTVKQSVSTSKVRDAASPALSVSEPVSTRPTEPFPSADSARLPLTV